MKRNGTLDALGLAAVLGAGLWALSLVQCSPAKVPTSEPSCAGACVQLERLGCQEAETTDAGVTCEAWCTRYHAPGYMRPWAECVSGAGSADDVYACGVRCSK